MTSTGSGGIKNSANTVLGTDKNGKPAWRAAGTQGSEPEVGLDAFSAGAGMIESTLNLRVAGLRDAEDLSDSIFDGRIQVSDINGLTRVERIGFAGSLIPNNIDRAHVLDALMVEEVGAEYQALKARLSPEQLEDALCAAGGEIYDNYEETDGHKGDGFGAFILGQMRAAFPDATAGA